MTNGDKIRQLNNEELAHLIFGFITTSIDSTFFKGVDIEENLEDNKGYKLLLEIMNEEVDY